MVFRDCLLFLLSILLTCHGKPPGGRPKDVVLNEKMLYNVPEITKKSVIAADKLIPADHMDVVKMEQDGHINKDFHKEAFLGNHEEIDDDPAPIAETKLKEIFMKVDKDRSGDLTLGELENWIVLKINEHFNESLREHDLIWKHIDTKGKGHVLWMEYYTHFLLAKGYDVKTIDSNTIDYDNVQLKEEEREAIGRYKMKWTEADRDNNNQLTKDEFLEFRHPEHSKRALDNMIDTILMGLDQNNDSKLTEKEFIALPPGEVIDAEQKKLDLEWQEERRREFKKIVKDNKDGEATHKELMDYVDPRNPDQAHQEAENLMNLMDEDHNGKLSVKEMLNNKGIFIESKVVDVKRVLHDEF